MAIAHRPETITTLRARHEAFRIATSLFRGGGVDVEHLTCHACGQPIDWKAAAVADGEAFVDCPSCGTFNELPCHLRYRIPPNEDPPALLEYASAEPDRRQWWNDVIPVALTVEPEAEVKRWPTWLKGFCLAMLGLVLATLSLMLLSAHL
jgi:hypothetical protein